MKTEAQVYREAAELLRRKGWCKYKKMDSEGRHCILGAIEEISPTHFMASMTPVLNDLIGSPYSSTFNDHCCETIDDAVTVLEIAADLAS